MTRQMFTAALRAAVLVAVCSPAFAQSLDVKPGTWRWTMTMDGAAMTLPETMPAEVREKILAQAKTPRTLEDCLTAEELKQMQFGQDDGSDCKMSNLKVTARSADYTRTCGGRFPRTETVHVESASPERMRVVATRKGAASGSATLDGVWVGAACKAP